MLVHSRRRAGNSPDDLHLLARGRGGGCALVYIGCHRIHDALGVAGIEHIGHGDAPQMVTLRPAQLGAEAGGCAEPDSVGLPVVGPVLDPIRTDGLLRHDA